jgi:TPR repeat protein
MRLIFAAALAAALMLGAPGIGRAQDDSDSDPGSTAFNNGDFATAMKDWQMKAATGDPEAMTNIGTLYNLGLGTHKDLNEAGKWYEKAAQLGFVSAQFNLANLYYNGGGFPHDLKQAVRWYTAAAQGGHLTAQFYLAQMYETGDGVEQSQDKALQWYQKAADKELPDAQYALGKKLIFGDGVTADPNKGSDLVLKAAEQRFVLAQILMADCYWRGRAVPKNPIEAYVWAAQAQQYAKKPQDKKRADQLFSDVKSGMSADQVKAAKLELTAVNPPPQDDSSGGDTGNGSAQ